MFAGDVLEPKFRQTKDHISDLNIFFDIYHYIYMYVVNYMFSLVIV